MAESINSLISTVWPQLTTLEVAAVLFAAASTGRTPTGWGQAMAVNDYANYLGNVYQTQGRQALLNTLQPFVTTVIAARNSTATPEGAAETSVSYPKLAVFVAAAAAFGYFAGNGFSFGKKVA